MRARKIIVLIVIDVLLLVVVGWQIWNKVDTPKSTASDSGRALSSTSSSISSSADTSTQSVSQLSKSNTDRDNDASLLLSSANLFASDNNGYLPSSIGGGKLLGTNPGSVPTNLPAFAHYATANVVSGAQNAVTQDKLVLIIGAACNQDGSTKAGTSRQFAAQYGTQKVNGTYSSTCIEG